MSAEIQVLQHDDRFLPLPFSPLSVRLEDAEPDDWRFDPATGTVFGRNVTRPELSYDVSAVEPRPSPARWPPRARCSPSATCRSASRPCRP